MCGRDEELCTVTLSRTAYSRWEVRVVSVKDPDIINLHTERNQKVLTGMGSCGARPQLCSYVAMTRFSTAQHAIVGLTTIVVKCRQNVYLSTITLFGVYAVPVRPTA